MARASTAVQFANYAPGASFGPRRLRTHEFVWILRGSAIWTVHEPDPTAHLLEPGQLSLARPGTVDSYHWDSDRETVHAYVHFTVRDRGSLPSSAWPSIRSMSTLPVLDGLCRYLLDLAGESGAAAQRRSDQLLGVLLDLFVTGPVEQPASLSPTVTAALQVVRRQWRDHPGPVPIPAVAAGAGVSAGHLFRIFRAEFGCSPARALELVRLARAATLLQRSNATVAEIARRCGFANPYHFSRRFAGCFGLPPGAYRTQGDGRDPYEQVRAAGLLPVARALLETGVSAAR